ncbi:adenylate/guanylate cyclase domain-containing protein [Larkinella knui]|uniref:Adenylate/guanylate cyclase domain-containing protein n=1 Tax=Larkinella knui TaxID=2025310 RepID=A0A3P1CW55_9BACT|nr:adenylate/guanylate cyclase domain-containing protein [Larkinella knui]RRB17647.1 adenylate/guanylate cyclase domain-containing protein [Larkinella knui]
MTFVYRKRQKAEISPYFNLTFAQENLRREKQRAGLMAVVFSLGVIIALFFHSFIPDSAFPQKAKDEVLKVVFSFVLFMSLYELSIWNLFRVWLRKGVTMPQFTKFLNATFEVTSISLLMYLISDKFEHPILVMLSPFATFYYFFIILSTLRLNFWISFYTGLVAGLEYLLLSLYLLEEPSTTIDSLDLYMSVSFAYILKAGILVLCGACAGFVSRQIQKSIQTSIESSEIHDQLVTFFGQQVSPEIADLIIKEKGMLKSQHMKVSVLFLDIRNFTKYADKHTADEVVAYQNSFFRIIVDVVNRHGGIVNQFLGDGCMITFGAPIPLENPAQNAVKAGLEIIAEIKKAVFEDRIIPTSVGIGVHVGDAVIGNIGTETRQQFSITGNVVILAARIEQLNKEYGTNMLVSQDVINELSEYPALTELLGVVDVKGMEEGVELYKLS